MTADVVHNGFIYNNMAVGNEAYSPSVIFFSKSVGPKVVENINYLTKIITYIEKMIIIYSL